MKLPGSDDLEDAVHVGRVDPVEVDRVRVRAAVDEVHPQQVVFGRPDHGAGDGAVVRPGGEETPGAISIVRSTAVRWYSRTRPGWWGSAGGG